MDAETSLLDALPFEKMCRVLLFLLVVFSAESSPVPKIDWLQQALPTQYQLLRTSGKSQLYSVILPNKSSYVLGKILVANLTGDRFEVCLTMPVVTL